MAGPPVFPRPHPTEPDGTPSKTSALTAAGPTVSAEVGTAET